MSGNMSFKEWYASSRQVSGESMSKEDCTNYLLAAIVDELINIRRAYKQVDEAD
jgi:hypothetical protein